MRGCAGFLAIFAIAACGACSGSSSGSRSSLGSRAPLASLASRFAACPHDAARAAGGRCACARGLANVEGACVDDATARAYCGGGSTWNGERCVTRACAPGEARDTANGACVVARTLREMAVRDHLVLDPDQRLGCHEHFALVVSAGHPACLPEALTCPRGERWNDGACTREPGAPCDPGEMRDARACVALFTPGSARDPYVLDVSRWASVAFGPEGGEGARDLCAPLAESPRAFGVGPAAKLAVRIEIELNFPDNDVTQVTAKVNATEALGPSGDRPIPSEGAALAFRSAASQVELLRALGGAASAASLSARVVCAIDGGLPPMSIPRAIPRDEAGPEEEHASSARGALLPRPPF